MGFLSFFLFRYATDPVLRRDGGGVAELGLVSCGLGALDVEGLKGAGMCQGFADRGVELISGLKESIGESASFVT